MAKPTEYTVQKHKLFIDALSIGSSLREACDYAGIKWRTWCSWKQRVLTEGDQFHPGVVTLVEEHEQAMERGRAALLAQLRQHSKKEWRAAAYLVDRRDEARERAIRVKTARVRLDKERAELELARLKIAAGGVDQHQHIVTPQAAAQLAREVFGSPSALERKTDDPGPSGDDAVAGDVLPVPARMDQ